MYDIIIIGAGIYGLYAAMYCAKRDMKVLVLECENEPFKRATYVNQARVHQGYHYPRSLATALKSASYFERFNSDFSFAINSEFEQIYATSGEFSWTNGIQFKKFCDAGGIKCEELNPNRFFRQGMCDGAFLTKEYTFDADLLRSYFVEQLQTYNNIEVKYGANISEISKEDGTYVICNKEEKYISPFILNATYASTNQISQLAGADCFKIKYELCEVILCDTNKLLENIGFTIMDGPFFSIMPFGKTGLHSLTSVTFTPHQTGYDKTPTFPCQNMSLGKCDLEHLSNCNECQSVPESAYSYMSHLARKYLLDKYDFSYRKSLFSIKPILLSSEVDDSRPTVIRKSSDSPKFVSVLSGKINTIYDLDEVLDNV